MLDSDIEYIHLHSDKWMTFRNCFMKTRRDLEGMDLPVLTLHQKV